MENYPTLLSINDFCKKHKFLTPSALRNKIFYADSNQMRAHKVLVRLGKRVYINEDNFFVWLNAQNETHNV